MNTRSLIVLATVVVLGAGCSDDDDTNNNNNSLKLDFSTVTYNGGLARGFVPYTDLRAQDVSEAVAALDVDLVCVQEFWLPEHVTMLEDAAAETFPNQLFLEPMPDLNPGEPACVDTDTDFLAFETCARNHCGNVPNDDLVDCVLDSCGDEYGAVTPECRICISVNVGGTIDEAVTACIGASYAYAYEGAFGIGLLTREAVTTSDSSVFASTFNRRAVLYAEVETEGLGTVHVFCTHLTAIFATIPWPKAEGSWQAEQIAQITAMRDYIDEKAGADGTVVLLGDFNNGPGGDSWVAEYEFNYNMLSNGYTSPYVDSPDAVCTFCDLNPLNGGIDHDESVVIDHILFRNFDGDTTASRILDGPLTITTTDGTDIEVAYSDHYGVQVTFTADPPAQN